MSLTWPIIAVHIGGMNIIFTQVVVQNDSVRIIKQQIGVAVLGHVSGLQEGSDGRRLLKKEGVNNNIKEIEK